MRNNGDSELEKHAVGRDPTRTRRGMSLSLQQPQSPPCEGNTEGLTRSSIGPRSLSLIGPPPLADLRLGGPDDREIHPLLTPAVNATTRLPSGCDAPANIAVVALGQTVVAVPVKAKKKRIRVKTERRREQCRINQARYRNKQRSFAINLEDSVLQLQLQVQQLEAQRRSLAFSVNTRTSATRVAMEYCRLFRNGMTVTDPLPGSNRPTLEQQIQFVIAAFHADVRVGDSFGCESFLEQCRRFSTYYDALRLLPQAYIPVTMMDAKTTAEARVIMQLTITETTIRQVYPHLQQPQYRDIQWKLLGQRIECPVSMAFVVDEDGKTESVEWTIDFIGALQPHLTIDEVAIVVQQSQIARDAYLLQSDEASADEIYEEGCEDDDQDGGYLIHDGQGDDYVMV